MKKSGWILLGGFAVFALLYLLIPRPVKPTLGQYSAAPVLILDAGHGGEDGGATAADGTRESDLNLEITLRLESLAALCGKKVYLIRREDVSVHSLSAGTIAEKKRSDLKNRVSMVNSQPGALLLSIHQNHFSQAKYHGAQVFYGDADGSKEIAESVQESLREALDPKNRRKPKPAESVYLMRNVRNPAILVECGFLSNAGETELLRQPDYQKKTVAAILAPIIRMGRDTYDEIQTSLFLQRMRQ